MHRGFREVIIDRICCDGRSYSSSVYQKDNERVAQLLIDLVIGVETRRIGDSGNPYWVKNVCTSNRLHDSCCIKNN